MTVSPVLSVGLDYREALLPDVDTKKFLITIQKGMFGVKTMDHQKIWPKTFWCLKKAEDEEGINLVYINDPKHTQIKIGLPKTDWNWIL